LPSPVLLSTGISTREHDLSGVRRSAKKRETTD
jgi:hypothetical protein